MNKNTWFFVVNPAADAGKGAQAWQKIEAYLKLINFDYDFAISQQAKHCIDLAKQAVEKGYQKIAAVGGDGTAHEVINGLLLQKSIPSQHLTFGIIPIGTGNDWIKTHQLPKHYKQAIALLQIGKTSTHDIGQIYYHDDNGMQKSRYFINVAGLAYDAFVTKATLNRPRWGNSQLYYFYLILKCVREYKAQPVSIQFNNKKLTHNFFNITVGICRYNGGGTTVVPQAVHNDGLFALTLFKDIQNWEVLAKAPRFYTGSIIKHKEAIATQTASITIEAPQDTPAYVEADGEYLGQTPISFVMHTHAIKVIIP